MHNGINSFSGLIADSKAQEDREVSNTIWDRALQRVPSDKRIALVESGFDPQKEPREDDYIPTFGTMGYAELRELILFDIISSAVQVLYARGTSDINVGTVTRLLNAGRYNVSDYCIRKRLIRAQNDLDSGLERAYRSLREEYGIELNPVGGKAAGFGLKNLYSVRRSLIADLLNLNRFLLDSEIRALTRLTRKEIHEIRSDLAKENKIPSEAFPEAEAKHAAAAVKERPKGDDSKGRSQREEIAKVAAPHLSNREISERTGIPLGSVAKWRRELTDKGVLDPSEATAQDKHRWRGEEVAKVALPHVSNREISDMTGIPMQDVRSWRKKLISEGRLDPPTVTSNGRFKPRQQ